ncbi:MAG: hypothetical protein PHV07_09025 [Oscillospiraceae bacterium]|nr:hypothetical protein [Oscillospiraceae bacterium]
MTNDEIQKISPQLPTNKQPQQIDVHMEQSGGGGKQFGFVEHYEDHKMVAVYLPPSADDDDDNTPEQIELDLSCYNLFVIADEMFKGKYFIVPKDRAITADKCTSKELWPLAYLTEECIRTIKTFPAIFTSTNHLFARTDERHNAFFGIVRDVRVKEEGIWIYFYKYRKLKQQILNEHALEFAIQGTEFKNELDETRWSIKKINVVEALNKNGCNIKLL